MLTTHRAPGKECNTPLAQAQHTAGAACQHRFAAPGRPHYCTYIQVQGVLAVLRPATTPDEHLIVSYLAASVLWWHLQLRELAALERALSTDGPLGMAQELLIGKRLDRCITLAQTAQEASALLSRYITNAAPHITVGFRIEGTLVNLHQVRALDALTTRLHARLRPARSGSPELRRRMVDYVALAEQVKRSLLRLLAALNDSSQPAIPLKTLLPEELLSWAELTLARHHPQTQGDPDDTDPLVFIVAHQLFEVWFPATISALEEAVRRLLHEPPAVLDALSLVHRSADLVCLWHRMIHLPQTMSAPDYIAFRAQLEGGSGAESEQFRQLEILAGLRSADYRQTMEQMQLLTPRLEALWQQPGLNEAIIRVLVARGIVIPDTPLPKAARRVADMLLPGGAGHPQADVAALCRAALMLDEQLALWRHHHKAMVASMVGGKPSLGVGEIANHEWLARDQEARAVGGLPYLEQTTSYQLFPLLHQALDFLQEDWQAVASGR